MRQLCREAESLLGVLLGDPTPRVTLRVADTPPVDVRGPESMRWWTDEELDQLLPGNREVDAVIVVEETFNMCWVDLDQRIEPAAADPYFGIGQIRTTLPRSSLGNVVAIAVALCSAVRWGSGIINEGSSLYRGANRLFADGDATALTQYLKISPGHRDPREAALEVLEKTGVGSIGLMLILEGQDNMGHVINCGGDRDKRTIRGLGLIMAGPLEARPFHQWLASRVTDPVGADPWTDSDFDRFDDLLAGITPWPDWLSEEWVGSRSRPADEPFWMRIDRQRFGQLALCCIPVATSLGPGTLEVRNGPDVVGEWQ